ncbi:Ribokinase-like protein [Panus rudis PR-1116 ss-1]|nr:Ribokinase-like protein [Panus rudis PR-1116 ss-1]
MSTRCLVRGSINVDEFFHVPSVVVPGETISSTNYERRAGGKDGEWLLESLNEYGVVIERIIRVEGEPTGRAIIQLTPEGENCIILHRGANYTSYPSDNVLSTPFTHLLTQNEIPFDSTLAALSHAHSIGATTIFNPSPMPSPSQLQTFPWTQLSWLIVNQGEATSLLKAFAAHDVTAELRAAPKSWPKVKDVEHAYELLQRLHLHPTFSPSINLVCTLGGLGVIALVNELDEPVYVPAAKLDGPVRDTTGAGDCFTGYMVAELMRIQEERGREHSLSEEDVKRVFGVATTAAGMCVQVPGAMESIPSARDVATKLS